MGEARRRGSFEDRKAEAIKAGRFPEIARMVRRGLSRQRAAKKQARLAYMRKFYEELSKQRLGTIKVEVANS